MIVAYATETETIPHIRKVGERVNLPRLVAKLYRLGAAYVEMIPETETETETETERE